MVFALGWGVDIKPLLLVLRLGVRQVTMNQEVGGYGRCGDEQEGGGNYGSYRFVHDYIAEPGVYLNLTKDEVASFARGRHPRDRRESKGWLQALRE